jgi:hypothetical protein
MIITEGMKSMSITDEQIAETTFEVAAEMALALGMTPEEDMTTLWEGQRVMMVTATGIVVGKIRVARVESRAGNARFETYLLNDTILSPAQFSETRLCKYMFLRNAEGGWNEEADIACSLPEGAALYVR